LVIKVYACVCVPCVVCLCVRASGAARLSISAATSNCAGTTGEHADLACCLQPALRARALSRSSACPLLCAARRSAGLQARPRRVAARLRVANASEGRRRRRPRVLPRRRAGGAHCPRRAQQRRAAGGSRTRGAEASCSAARSAGVTAAALAPCVRSRPRLQWRCFLRFKALPCCTARSAGARWRALRRGVVRTRTVRRALMHSRVPLCRGLPAVRWQLWR
jgi:hypothetical protein